MAKTKTKRETCIRKAKNCLPVTEDHIYVKCPVCKMFLQLTKILVPRSSLHKREIYFEGICYQCPDRDNNSKGRIRSLRFKAEEISWKEVPDLLPLDQQFLNNSSNPPVKPAISAQEILEKLHTGEFEGV